MRSPEFRVGDEVTMQSKEFIEKYSYDQDVVGYFDFKIPGYEISPTFHFVAGSLKFCGKQFTILDIIWYEDGDFRYILSSEDSATNYAVGHYVFQDGFFIESRDRTMKKHHQVKDAFKTAKEFKEEML